VIVYRGQKVRLSRRPADLEIQVKHAGLPPPRHEFKFHPEREWRVDFCWPEVFLAVEIEGGIWTGSRHAIGAGYLKDMEKYNELAVNGFSLLRFTPDDVEKGKAIATIRRWFKKREAFKPLFQE
jgi:very-short-patch-repair endonuclease